MRLGVLCTVATSIVCMLPLFSCKEEPNPYSGPLDLLRRNPITGQYEAQVGDTIDLKSFASSRKKIQYVDVELVRYRKDNEHDKSWGKQIFFETFYNIPGGDTLEYEYILPDTLSSTPGNDQNGNVRDRIKTQTRYKGGSDESSWFNILIKEKED